MLLGELKIEIVMSIEHECIQHNASELVFVSENKFQIYSFANANSNLFVQKKKVATKNRLG